MTESEKGITIVGLSPTMRSITQANIYREVMKMSIGGKEVVCVGSTEKELNDLLDSCSDQEITELSAIDFTELEKRIVCPVHRCIKPGKTGRNKADRKRNRANRWR